MQFVRRAGGHHLRRPGGVGGGGAAGRGRTRASGASCRTPGCCCTSRRPGARARCPTWPCRPRRSLRVRAQMEEVLSRHTGQDVATLRRGHRPGQDVHRRAGGRLRAGRPDHQLAAARPRAPRLSLAHPGDQSNPQATEVPEMPTLAHPAGTCAYQRPISGAVLSGPVGFGSAQLTEAGQRDTGARAAGFKLGGDPPGAGPRFKASDLRLLCPV